MALVADIFKVNLIDDTGEVIATDTLQDANIEVSVDANDVRGGRGNGLIGILHSNRDVNISLTDPIFRYSILAKQLGKDIVTGAGTAYAMPKFYTVEDDLATTTTTEMQITLDNTPSDSASVKIYNLDGKEITGFTVSGAVVDFATASPAVAVGDKVEVRTYTYQTDATAETIEIDSESFAKGVKIVLETLEIDNDETPIARLQYQFDEALPDGSFSMNTSSERSAQTQEFNLRAIKPKGSDVIGRVIRIPIA